VKYGDIKFLPESPLGVLFQSRILLPCFDDTEVYFASSKENPKVRLFPYSRLHGWGKAGNPFLDRGAEPVVRVVGVPYHGTAYDMNRFTTITKGDEDYLVVLAHCLASEQGGSMFEAEDVIRYADLVNLDPQVCIFGHWHKDQGIKQIAKDKWVVNTGSLSRGSLSQDELNRTPVCVVMTFDTAGVSFVKEPLVVAPSTEVFDLVGHTRQELRQTTVDGLVESLKTTLTTRSEGSLLEEIRGVQDIPEEVRERALVYLERAGAR